MRVVRAPFRVSFLGGGSDLPRHYLKHGGAVLSTAIDQRMFISGRPMFDPSRTLLKYSRTELVESLDQIEHPIFREALKYFNCSGVDLSVSSDIPAGTGLGSSSTFTVALVKLLAEMSGKRLSKMEIGSLACMIELDILGEPIGKQDQYASALGGMNLIRFEKNGEVLADQVNLSPEDLSWLADVMWLVKVPGSARSASTVLKEAAGFVNQDATAERALCDLAQLAIDGYRQIELSGVRVLPNLVAEAWELKKKSSPESHMSIAAETVSRGQGAGAKAAKLLGAGGGGFVLFFVEQAELPSFLAEFSDERVLRVRPDLAGVTTIYEEEGK